MMASCDKNNASPVWATWDWAPAINVGGTTGRIISGRRGSVSSCSHAFCTPFVPRDSAAHGRAHIGRLLSDDHGPEGERRRQRHHRPPDGLHEGGAGAA